MAKIHKLVVSGAIVEAVEVAVGKIESHNL
jgi:hypothetical protein